MKKISLVSCLILLTAICTAQLQRLNNTSTQTNKQPVLRLNEEKYIPLSVDTGTTRYYANPSADIISNNQMLNERIDKIIQNKETNQSAKR